MKYSPVSMRLFSSASKPLNSFTFSPKRQADRGLLPVGKESARRLTFDPVVEKFDEKLYSDVQQAVAHNKEPTLKLDDQRVSPPTFTEPNRFKPEPGQH
jgi:hypothetical protein